MSNDTFYRLQANVEIDNPDERITDDVKSYTQTTLSFFLLSLNAVITSMAFLGVLWSITPRLVIAAVIYAAAGSAATIILGRPLVRLANLQLKKEADLRYHLIQTRESSETIATMHAERPVSNCLHERLGDVVANNKIIIAVTRNLGFFIKGYNYLTQLIPLLLVAPLYMRGEVEFGVVTQSAMAFSAFLGAFSLIITQFETISSFAAVTDRLNRISEAIDQAQVLRPTSHRGRGGRDTSSIRRIELMGSQRAAAIDPGPYVGDPPWLESAGNRLGRVRQDRALPGNRPGLGERERTPDPTRAR